MINIKNTRTIQSNWLKRLASCFMLTAALLLFMAAPLEYPTGSDNFPGKAFAAQSDHSDMNSDGYVDLEDVKLYAEKELGEYWEKVDWCAHEFNLKTYRALSEFVDYYFNCLVTEPVLSNPTVSQVDLPPTLGATIVSGGDSPIVERGTVWNTTGPPVTENPLAEGGTTGGTFSHQRADLSDVLPGTTVYFAGYAINEAGKLGISPHGSFVIEYSPADVPALSKPVVLQPDMTTTLGATIDSDGNDPVYERGTVWNITGPPVTENALAEGGTALGAFSHDRPDLMNVPAGTTVYFCGYAENDVGIGYSPVGSFAVKDRLEVKNVLTHPARLALGPDGRLYVSDPKVKSIFIYDTNLQLTGELKGLDSPVGVAVDSFGSIYVGNTGTGSVERYSSEGTLLETIGAGSIRMPTDLTLDKDDNLYVADSQSNIVWVYRHDGSLLRTIRKGGLKFPIGVEIAYYDDGTGQMVGELYVADKENFLVKVFDLQGNLRRSFGGMVKKGGMLGTTWYWKGKFLSLQSLAKDAQGRLHALDLYMNKIQILNSGTGAYIAYYGEAGTNPGQLKLPLDIIINSSGQVIVANAENKKVEIIYTIP